MDIRTRQSRLEEGVARLLFSSVLFHFSQSYASPGACFFPFFFLQGSFSFLRLRGMIQIFCPKGRRKSLRVCFLCSWTCDQPIISRTLKRNLQKFLFKNAILLYMCHPFVTLIWIVFSIWILLPQLPFNYFFWSSFFKYTAILVYLRIFLMFLLKVRR